MRAKELIRLTENLMRETNIAIETYLGKSDHEEESEELTSIARNNTYDTFVTNKGVKSILKNIQQTTYAPLTPELLASYVGIKR